MANDMNQCNFTGRLGADPETRNLQSGMTVTNFRIAVGWKTKEKEGVDWVPVSTFGKLAEICQQYLRKGTLVRITGRYKTREYDDKNGNKQRSTEINADDMQILSSKQDSQQQSSQPQQQSRHAPEPEFDSDIPF
jgi:single-strand DNA-binding protein